MENKGRNHLLTVHVLMPLLGTGQFHIGLLHGPKAVRLDITLRPSPLRTDRPPQSRSHPSTSSSHSLSNEGNWFLSKVSEDQYLGLTSLPAPKKKSPRWILKSKNSGPHRSSEVTSGETCFGKGIPRAIPAAHRMNHAQEAPVGNFSLAEQPASFFSISWQNGDEEDGNFAFVTRKHYIRKVK